MDIEGYIFSGVMTVIVLGFSALMYGVYIDEQDKKENVECRILHVETRENIKVNITGCHRIDRNQEYWWISTKKVGPSHSGKTEFNIEE